MVVVVDGALDLLLEGGVGLRVEVDGVLGVVWAG